MGVIFVLLCLVLIVRTVHSEPVDNGVYGEPEIQCEADSVAVNFNTHNTFEGHLYVKGHYDEAGCRTDATNDRSATIKIPFTACGVRRERSINPAGLLITTTVVISFHPMFVTKVDRAYNVKCFYMAADKPVTANLEVSMFSTQLLTQNLPMPTCKYEVLEGGPTGQPVKYAVVGQEVYHKWSCQSETKNAFCMTVHSCFVDDGKDKKVQLLDENGCAQDKYLMNNLYYDDDLQGGVTSLVFKYADKPTLFFQCQIRLHYKEESYKCQRTSDVCPWPTRGKRAVNMTKAAMKKYEDMNFLVEKSDSFDVVTEPLTILDIDDANLASEKDLLKAQEQRNRILTANGRLIRNNADTFCFSPITFGVIVALLGIVLLTSLLSILLFYLRKRKY